MRQTVDKKNGLWNNIQLPGQCHRQKTEISKESKYLRAYFSGLCSFKDISESILEKEWFIIWQNVVCSKPQLSSIKNRPKRINIIYFLSINYNTYTKSSKKKVQSNHVSLNCQNSQQPVVTLDKRRIIWMVLWPNYKKMTQVSH